VRAAAFSAFALIAAVLSGWQSPSDRRKAQSAQSPGSPARQISVNLPGRDGERVAVAPVGSGATRVRTLLNIRKPMQYGDYRWNEDGVPPGPLWIRVGLHEQLLSVFRGGHEIGTAVILYGADKKPTPLGTFPILARFQDHRSGPYDAPMPFTLRLTPDGVSIHGSNVRWGAATHGCVGVPLEFAKKLYDQTRLGDVVTITDERLSHA
jgi:lipoprotein-anchoring transpeptidase ErfK/SrfK